MAFYEINLAVLVLINAVLFLRQRKTSATAESDRADSAVEEASERKWEDDASQRTAFIRKYLSAYLLATAGDWLQVN